MPGHSPPSSKKPEKKIAAKLLAKKIDDHALIPEPVARLRKRAPKVNSKLAAKGNKR